MGWWLLAVAVLVLAIVAWRMKRSTAAGDGAWKPGTFNDRDDL
jgi:hypothetical protein